MLAQPTLLTSTEAAALLGVSASSVKRWAEEGTLACVKTAGRHRRFARAELERFLRTDLEAAADAPAGWLDALLATTDVQALTGRLLDDRARLGSWARVADSLGPVIEALGHRWASGEISVVEEHLASERLSRALARVSELIPLPLHPRHALLATAEGDEHTLGLSLVEVTLRELGWLTLWVGRKVPSEDLVEQLGSMRPPVRLLAVSASAVSIDERRLARQATRLQAACARAGVALVLGGAGRWPTRLRHARRLHALEDLRDLAQRLEERRP